jgi:hypothetical protein
MSELDQAVPIVAFIYGVVILLITSNAKLMELAQTHFQYAEIFRSRRALAFVCLVVGGLWTLQNIWL